MERQGNKLKLTPLEAQALGILPEQDLTRVQYIYESATYAGVLAQQDVQRLAESPFRGDRGELLTAQRRATVLGALAQDAVRIGNIDTTQMDRDSAVEAFCRRLNDGPIDFGNI